jgi:hypothetical protein
MLALALAQGKILQQLGQIVAKTAQGSSRRASCSRQRRRERERSKEVRGSKGSSRDNRDNGRLEGRVGGSSNSKLLAPPSPLQQLEDKID